MKNLLLFATALFLSIGQLSAQCTPDPQYTSPGIFPDSATGLAGGCVGQYYEQIITVVVPPDTCVEIIQGWPCQTFTIDSIVVTSWTGLPASLTYQCASTLGNYCSFPGGQTGCAIISGTPVLADVGTHNLVINVDSYVGGLSTPQGNDVIDWYFIDIQDCGTSGLNETFVNTMRVYPNPANNTINIDGVPANVSNLSIISMNGQVVESIDNPVKNQAVNIEKLDIGVYFIRMDNGTVLKFTKN